MKTYKLYPRVFWTFKPNFIRIHRYNFDLCRFKVVAFFETQYRYDSQNGQISFDKLIKTATFQ